MVLRALVATFVGLVVAVPVDFGVNALIHGSPPHGYGSMQSLTGLFGVICGVVVGLISAFVLFHLRLSDRGRRNVWAAGGATCILFGIVFSMWLFALGVPPLTTLEGAWIYPTWTSWFAFGIFAITKARRAT